MRAISKSREINIIKDLSTILMIIIAAKDTIIGIEDDGDSDDGDCCAHF